MVKTYNCPVVRMTTSLLRTSPDQRPEEQSGLFRGLPQVQQRGAGIAAGGSHTGVGGEAGRRGKVR